jgi:hypothetical protein
MTMIDTSLKYLNMKFTSRRWSSLQEYISRT